MKKFKLAIMIAAILVSVGGAFVTRAATDCTLNQNYFLSGSNYVATGVFGHDYYCGESPGTCTYIQSGGGYAQCRMGVYLPANGINEKDQQQKK